MDGSGDHGHRWAPTGADGTRCGAVAKIGDLAAEAGIRRVHVLAWRDLADVEAGGSEVHAAAVCRLWAAAGLEVTMRTSYAQGAPPETVRDGYRVIRRAGRYLVFPRAVAAELAGRHGPRDALVEIWNGVPFLSPLWARGPRLVFLHHVHQRMWPLVLPAHLARIGDLLESRIAPPLYRRTDVVTLSSSSKAHLVERLGLRPRRVHVVPPGIDPVFGPGGERSPRPLVVAVGRLMPAKAFDTLIRAVADLRPRLPVRLVIAGEGYERDHLERVVADLGAEEWCELPGRLPLDAVVDLYRRAWVVASASVSEGWGMTLTEAAACGTPAVATRIAGHLDAVVDGTTGLLAEGRDGLTAALERVLTDPDLRDRLGRAALGHAAGLSWERTALETLRILTRSVRRRPTPPRDP